MQKGTTISRRISILKPGLSKLGFKINVLMLMTLGLFSNLTFAQLPLEEFTSGIPATWAVESNQVVTNNWVPTTPTGGYLNTPGVSVNPSLNNTVGTTAEYFLITSQFSTPQPDTEVRFFTKQGSFTNRGTIYQVRLSVANQPDLDSFNVVLASWTEAQLNVSATTWEEKIVTIPDLPQGIPVYLAFVAITNQTGTTGTSGDTWFIDNARVITACAPVTGINSAMTASGGLITWSHPTANDFEIQIVDDNAGIAASGTPVTGTSFNATTLTNGNPFVDGTNYDVYIKTVCDPTTGSSWAGPFNIQTSILGLSCATPVVIPTSISSGTPYVLSSNLANYYTDTDYTSYTTVGSSCFPPGTSNQLSGNHIFFTYTPTSNGLIDITQAVSVVSGGGGNNCYNGGSSIMVFGSCADVGTSCLAAAMTPTSGSSTVQIPNFYVQAGQTYVIVMSSPYQHTNPGAGICFTFTVSSSTCPSPSPSSFTYSDLTQTSANFSWGNVANLISTWDYIVLPASASVPDGSTTGYITTTSNVNQPAGVVLSPATDYKLYVRSVCGGTPGSWSPGFPFRTPCNALPLPYYTGFNDATLNDACWSQINLNNDNDIFNIGAPALGGGSVAKLRVSAAGNNTNDMLVSPQFHLTAGTPQRLRFKYNNYGNWGTIASNPTGGPCSFEVKLSTTGIGAQSFTTTVVPLAERTTAYNYVEMTVPLPDITADINLAWILPAGATQTGVQFYLDDVYIENMPTCSEPSYPVVTAGSITTTTAEVSWTNGYNNSVWQIVAQPLGTGTPVLPGGPGVILFDNVTSNPFTLTGLASSTRYEFYVRAYCSSTDQSVWAGPINFNTLCTAQPTPYYESFNDDDVNTKKFCWSTNNVDNDPAQWAISATEASIRPQPVSFFNPFVAYNDWLISGPVNAVGPKRLRFKYRVTTTPLIPTSPRGNFEVLLSSTPDFATFTTLIPLHDFSNQAFEEDEVLFTGTGVIYVAFRLPANMPNPGQTGIVTIDDFVIEDAPACPNPSDLAVANITETTANLSWTAGYQETRWEIVLQEQGNGIPTGSGIVVNTVPAYNAINLSQNTAYEYYVRAICNAPDVSEWVGPFDFRTICNALPTPFIETFDSNTTTETCWTIYNNNGDGNTWNLNQTANPIFGDQMAALFTGSNGNNNDWLITPTIMANAGQRLRFFYKTYSSDFEEDLKVMLSTTGVAPSAFASNILYENNFTTTVDAAGTTAGSNVITVTNGSGVRVGDTFYIPGFPIPYATTVTNVSGNTVTVSAAATLTMAGPLHIVFTHETINNTVEREMVINLTDITSPTNINIAFHTPYFPPNPWNYRGQYTFIDNVIIENIPACPSVINVTTQNITDVTAQTNWQSTGTETNWEISLQPYGTPAPVGSTLPAYLITTSAHPYTFNGLTPATRYQYYVRAICNGSSQSEWVGPFEFTTRCDVTNVCQYTFTVSNGNTGQVHRALQIKQNEVVVQELTFPVVAPGQPLSIDYQVYLCNGVAFDVYWDGFGNGTQYSQAQLVIKDALDNVVWTSPQGLGTIHTNIYSGFASCGTITCPQPTNLTVSNQGVLSWTPGGSETQWEVFVQPVENGTLPQANSNIHVVNNTPSYTPSAAAGDFVNGMAGTYEYFVRAVCGTNDKSFWYGPKVFVINDEPATAIRLAVNTGNTCDVSGVDASFIGATPSSVPTSCPGVNGGDIWYDFIATSKVHNIELSDFAPGSYYLSSGDAPWPKIIMSLYEEQSGGVLVEKACSENNSITASYASELIVGNVYKIRLKLNDTRAIDKRFHICITTPEMCDMNAFNYDFEKFPMQTVSGVSSIVDATVVPGWRVNTDYGAMFYLEGNNIGVTPYSGGQCLQLVQDGAAAWNPSDPNIKGLYRDFDTSGIAEMEYSFASATRGSGTTTVQLFAGPPSGPFTMIAEDSANSLNWDFVQGTYSTNNQPTTRFIFRVVGNALGHLLDAANFKANNKIKASSQAITLTCDQTSSTVEAYGTGEWIADTNNPAVTIIGSSTSPTTTISGFNTPGVYTYYWVSRYCQEAMTITYQGFFDVPTVTSPVAYCQSDVAVALTATATSGYTLQWFTEQIGGTGDANAPIPSTATVGTTTYYVALVDSNGCVGPRVALDVVVNPLITPVVDFSYDETTYCTSSANPVLIPAANFATGGTYSVSPSGLTLDTTTGAINLATSTAGTYTVTYLLPRVGCTLQGTSSFSVEVVQEVTFDLVSECDSQVMYLNVEPTNGSDLSNVDYEWEDVNGNTIATQTSTLNVNDYLIQNSDVTLPTTISVTVSLGGCTSTKSYVITVNECSLIPRGVSPNNDGDNDTFDLTGLGVRELSIFNRYGSEVYSFNGNYTNQWNGNDKNGSHLPDGTYFYSITFQDGKSVTGWVYVIRQY